MLLNTLDKEIAVIDYGLTNLMSMLRMLEKAGLNARPITSPKDVLTAKKLILPGIGSFDQGVNALRERGLFEAILEIARAETADILGVCLGMQLLMEGSDEGTSAGLGLIPGRCVRVVPPPNSMIRVPHVGWNRAKPIRQSKLFDGIAEEPRSRFYFVHSYYVACTDSHDVLAQTCHGFNFTSALQRGRLFGTQFHPEKSHRYGMMILKNFAEM